MVIQLNLLTRLGLGVAVLCVVATASSVAVAAPALEGFDNSPSRNDPAKGLLLDGLDSLLDEEPLDRAPLGRAPLDRAPLNGAPLDGARDNNRPGEETNPPRRRGGGPSWLPNRKELDRLMKDSLGAPPAGEDLGESPLVTVRSTMDTAGRLIAARDDGTQTRPTQEDVVRRLDELIKKMEKQCQSCNSSGQCNKPSQQSRRSKPKPAAGEPKQQAASPSKSQSAARESSQRLSRASAADAASEAARADAVKRVWGRLPERLRELLLQGSSDEFLPEYSEEIEQYFQRLAEEPQEN